jgi:hypothetical protein
MANCCGGKNAGKPISWGRYAAGLGVFVGYHGAMRVLLEVAARVKPELGKVRDFHRDVFETELKEVLKLEDINVNGRLGAPQTEGICEINPNLGEVVSVSAGADAPDFMAPLPPRVEVAAAPEATAVKRPSATKRRGRAPLSVVSPV